jgi:phosphate transport system substrate-binding protein
MRRLLAVSAAIVAFCVSPLAAASPASGAVTHALISGSGSSWAANAVNQWISDVTSNGLQVVFTAGGSAQGRTDFRNVTTDFAVSDIGFQGVDSVTGESDTNCTNPNKPSTCRPYAYLPIVAGGTSFPYQIKVGGQLVRNLRLSGETLTKIFTNKITNWDDPEITKDNNGHALPSLAIIPVVHSEGSGSTAQFTRYMDTEYPSLWRPFSGTTGLTEYYPPNKTGQVAENGSDGVINFVTSAAANGAIGYDEYSYALGKNYPVAQLENKAGYFTSPTQYNVAVALTRAQIDTNKKSPDYLLQNLNNVYTSPDKRAYAMSSYSYMIIPTSRTDQRMTTAKRQTLADFLYWDICGGQAEMGPIGYSPLPINLVQASFAQTNKLHAADKNVQLSNENVTTCHNPTFVAGHPSENYLAKIAPEPPKCDEVGEGPCAAGTGTGPTGNPTKTGKAPKSTGGGSSNTGGAKGSSNSGGTSGSPGGDGSSSGGTAGSSGTARGSGGSVPTTTTTSTLPGSSTAPVLAGQSGNSVAVVGTPITLPSSNNGGIGTLLAVLAALELLLVLAIPPIVARHFQRRKAGP